MSAPAWMPLYVADYLADTGHLGMAEHGAYMLLIMHYWRNDKLPNDDRSLASICQANALQDWLQVREKVMALFQFEDGKWRHKRVDREKAHSKKISETRRKAGKSGAEARAKQLPAFAKQKPVQPQSHIKKEKATPSPKKGCRIPEDFEPDVAVGIGEGLSPSEAATEAANFIDHWKASAGANAVKRDWLAAWRMWCRNEIKWRRGRGPPPAKGANPLAKIVREAERKIAARGEGNDWESGRAEHTGGPIIEIETAGKSPRSGRS
jgi:uncharacterized protein YdaU (DUF1376 family)